MCFATASLLHATKRCIALRAWSCACFEGSTAERASGAASLAARLPLLPPPPPPMLLMLPARADRDERAPPPAPPLQAESTAEISAALNADRTSASWSWRTSESAM